jgi:hypothetical protein
MTIPNIRIWLLLAWGAVAAASSVTRHQTTESSFLSDIPPTRAALSHTTVEASTLITRLSINTATSSIASTSTNVADLKPETNPEPVESRTTADLDPSLQIVFLVLGTLFGLASVVVAIFFGHKQLSITTNQSNAERNLSDDDVELGRLDLASDESHISTDLTAHNNISHTFDVAFIRTLASGMVHIANELKSHLVAIWSFMRHPDDLVLPSAVAAHAGEPPNAGHEQQMHAAEPHG